MFAPSSLVSYADHELHGNSLAQLVHSPAKKRRLNLTSDARCTHIAKPSNNMSLKEGPTNKPAFFVDKAVDEA